MGYEIDFFGAGEGTKPCMAIALRYWATAPSSGDQNVIVIDGGTKDTGQRVVDHVQKYYHTKKVNLAVLTHMHDDHASGLRTIVENLDVQTLAMHRPWNSNRAIHEFMLDGRATEGSVKERLLRSLSTANELEAIAIRNGVNLIEPFSDPEEYLTTNSIVCLGPSKEYFAACMAAVLEDQAEPSRAASLAKMALEAMVAPVNKILDLWFDETLADPSDNEVSPTNNASAIVLIRFDDQEFLVTGDAGVPALTQALDKANELGLRVYRPRRLQIPHHGSKHNLGPTLLNRLCGPTHETELSDEECDMTAVACCAKGSTPKHPNQLVINALRRRAFKPYVAHEKTLRLASDDAPGREGWGPVDACPYAVEFDES